MSTRAIRALRERESYSVQQQHQQQYDDDDDDSDDDDTDDDDNNNYDTDNDDNSDKNNKRRNDIGTKSQSAFILVENASSDDDDDEDDDDEDITVNEMHKASEHDDDNGSVNNNNRMDDYEEEDEDIDALLEEFQLHDIKNTTTTTDSTIDRGILYLSQLENVIMENYDWKELDFQYTLHNNSSNKSDNSNTNENSNDIDNENDDKKNKKKSKNTKKKKKSSSAQNSATGSRSYDTRINSSVLFDLQQRKKRSRVSTTAESNTNYETVLKSNYIFGQVHNDKIIRSNNNGLFMIRYDQYRKEQQIQIQTVTTSEASASSSISNNPTTTTVPWPYNDKNLLLNLRNAYNSEVDNNTIMMTTTTAATTAATTTTNTKTTSTSTTVKSVDIDDDATTTFIGSDSADDKNNASAVNNNDVVDSIIDTDVHFCKYFYSFHGTIQYEKDCHNFDKLLSILNSTDEASTTTTTRSTTTMTTTARTNDNTMINTVLSYVIDHPYCCPALLYLSVSLLERIHSTTTVIDLVSDSPSQTIATASYVLLYRCLHLYEISMLLHFKHLKFKNNKTTTTVLQQRLRSSNNYTSYGPLLIDYYQKRNQLFFDSLQKYIRLCSISRVSSTALATCRLLLSIDPLRDPLAVLLIMDRFVLATSTRINTCNDTVQWFINFVESNIIQLVSNISNISSLVGINENRSDDENNFKKGIDHYSGGILDLPNIMFSYPLALYMMYSSNADYDMKVRADHALEAAIKRFPLMIEHILNHCTILDTTTYGEFYRQKPTWVPLLDYMKILSQKRDRAWTTTIANRRFQNQNNSNATTTTITTFRRDMIYLSAMNQVCERIIENYSYHCSTYWNDDNVLQWLYECIKQIRSVDQQREHEQSILSQVVPLPPSPAIIRYINFDLSVYDETIPQLSSSSSSSSSVDATTMIDIELLENVISMDPKRRKNSLKNRNNGSRLRGSSQQQQQNQHHYRLLLGDTTTTTNTTSDTNNSTVVTTIRDELEDNDENVHSTRINRPGGIYFGPPTHSINPDWPIVEVFWRSFLPWNYVIGIKPSSSSSQPAYQPPI